MIKLKRALAKSHSKKWYNTPTYYHNYSLYRPLNYSPTYHHVTPSVLHTPLTTGTFSRGGVLYHTNAPSIPYGTGYSYGPWTPIK